MLKIVLFHHACAPYQPGDRAAFSIEDAARFVRAKVAEIVGDAHPVHSAPAPDIQAGTSLRADKAEPLAEAAVADRRRQR